MLGVLPEDAWAQGRWWSQVAESLMATQAQAVSGKAVDRGGVHGAFGADDVGGPGATARSCGFGRQLAICQPPACSLRERPGRVWCGGRPRGSGLGRPACSAPHCLQRSRCRGTPGLH